MNTNTTCIISFFFQNLSRVTKMKQHKSRILALQCSINPQLAHHTFDDNLKPVAVNN